MYRVYLSLIAIVVAFECGDCAMRCFCSKREYDWVDYQNELNKRYCINSTTYADRCYYLPMSIFDDKASIVLKGVVVKDDGQYSAITVCDSNGHPTLINHENTKDYIVTDCSDAPRNISAVCKFNPDKEEDLAARVRRSCPNVEFRPFHFKPRMLELTRDDPSFFVQPIGYCSASCEDAIDDPSVRGFVVVSNTGDYRCFIETPFEEDVYDITDEIDLGNTIITYVNSINRAPRLKQYGRAYEDFGFDIYGRPRTPYNVKEQHSFSLCERFKIETTHNAISSTGGLMFKSVHKSTGSSYSSNGRLVKDSDACNPINFKLYDPYTLRKFSGIIIPIIIQSNTTASTSAVDAAAAAATNTSSTSESSIVARTNDTTTNTTTTTTRRPARVDDVYEKTTVRPVTKRPELVLVLGGNLADEQNANDIYWVITEPPVSHNITFDRWGRWPWDLTTHSPVSSASYTIAFIYLYTMFAMCAHHEFM